MEEMKYEENKGKKATITKVPAPLFEVIQCPYLEEWDSGEIKKLMAKWERYLKRMSEQDGTGTQRKPQELKACFGPGAITYFETYKFPGRKWVEITNEELETFLRSRPKGKTKVLNETMVYAEIKKRLEMKMHLSPYHRVETLFRDHLRLLKEHGMQHLVQTKGKDCVKHIIDSLAPPVLKEWVKVTLAKEDDQAKAKKDMLFLQEIVHTGAEAVEFNQIVYNNLRKKGEPSRDNKQGSQKKRKFEHQLREGSKEDKKPFGLPKEKFQKGKKKRANLECWHCKGDHTLFKCPTASTKDRDAAMLARKKRDVRRAGQIREGLDGQLGFKLEVKFCADSGADETLISNQMVEDLRREGVPVNVEVLPHPRRMGLPTQGDVLVVIGHAKVDMLLNTMGGPLRLRNVRTLITEGDLEEVLLGHPLLVNLGIDVDVLLGEVAKTSAEIDLITDSKPQRVRRTMEDIGQSDEGDTIPDPLPDIGEDDPVELQAALNLMLTEAEMAGAPIGFMEIMRDEVFTYKDIFRLAQGTKDEPVKVPPMKVALKPGVVPVRMGSRRYPDLVRQYMKTETERQLKGGLAYLNPTSRWVSMPFIVKKKVEVGKEVPLLKQYRMTVDLRQVNSVTEDTVWPMPNLEVVMCNLNGSVCYASFDLADGYWQFPLDKECQEYFSYGTDRGIFTPTRVPQGSKGAVPYFQSSMQLILKDLLYKSFLLWLDDLLAYASSWQELAEAICAFFRLCREYGLKLSARKCRIYQQQVIWCGRQISAAGVAQDPTRLQALQTLATPKTGGDLQQFVCAMNWVRMSMKDYAPTMAPLLALMEKVYSAVKSRKKIKVSKYPLVHVGWGLEHDQAWDKCRKMLAEAMTLAHVDSSKITCVFTDASQEFWGAIVTQIPQCDKDKVFEEQEHIPLAFLSHAFKGAQLHWAILEKEAFAIVETCKRLEYMLLSERGFRLYTDHRNLQYIFNPEQSSGVLHKHTAAKLQRWAVTLRSFQYEVEYIAGERNVWADLLSRWGAPQHSTLVAQRVRRLLNVPVSLLAPSCNFEWPSEDDIRVAQSLVSHAARPSSIFQRGDGIWCFPKPERVWIPSDAFSLQTRLCVIAHAGPAGHRGITSTTSALKQVFQWETLEADIKEFINQCIHCLGVKGSKKIPRPLGESVHSDRPGEVIHMDYGHMYSLPKEGHEGKRHQYLHILMDDCTNLVWLDTTEEPNAISTAETIEQWAALFGMPSTWVSDGGSHYKNQIVEELARRYGATHHITLAYCPWSNGTVENMVGQVKRVFKMLLAEFRMQQHQWPELVRMVQAALNSSPSEKLGGRSPIEAMTGIKPMKALTSILHPVKGTVCSLKEVSVQVRQAIEVLAKARDQIHKEVAASAKSKRDRHRDRHNKKQKGKLPNLMEGDYVLVASTEKATGQNLQVHWRGPRRIVSIPSEWTYEVEDLLQGTRKEVHVSRVKPYKDKDLEITQDLKDHAGHVESTLEADRFGSVTQNKETSTWEIQTFWRGFEKASATWEPIRDMMIYVPDMVGTRIRELESENNLPEAFKRSEEYQNMQGNQSSKKADKKAKTPKHKTTHEVKKKVPRQRKGLSSS